MAELISNGNFNNGLAGWDKLIGFGIIDTQQVGSQGANSVMTFSSRETKPDAVIEQVVTTPGKSFTGSFDFGTNGGTASNTAQVQMVIIVVGGGDDGEVVYNTGFLSDPTPRSSSVGNSTIDNHHSYSFTLPDDATGFRIRFVDRTPNTHNTDLHIDNVSVLGDPPPPCFVAGTMIATPNGPVPVESLAIGDLVNTLDHGVQPILWIGSRRFSAEQLGENMRLRPIRVAANALGAGRPARDTWLSRQHRVMISSPLAQERFGDADFLAPINNLETAPGIARDDDHGDITYFHFITKEHAIVEANGLWAETMLVAARAVKCLQPLDQMRVTALFPHIPENAQKAHTARIIRQGRPVKTLVAELARLGQDIQPTTIAPRKTDDADLAAQNRAPLATA